MPPRPNPTRRSTDSSEPPVSPSSSRVLHPIPQQDWTRRPSSSQSGCTLPNRRASAASSVHSMGGGGALDALSSRHIGPVTETSQNAISTLLQPPIVRTGLQPYTSAPSGLKAPTARDIPPVTLTNIPHVDASAFKPYLSQIGALYDALLRARAEPGKDEVNETPERRFNGQWTRAESTSSRGRVSSLSPTHSPPRRRSSAGTTWSRRHHTPAATPLSTIPDVYFQEDFRLENPRTFDVVSERSDVIQQPQGPDGNAEPGRDADARAPAKRKALATNAILQEKLSWYMDTVEIHLVSSISTASTSFFAALDSLRQLQSQTADSVARIQSLREDLGRLDRDMALGGLRIVGMRRRRDNVRKLSEAVHQLRAVVDGVAHCEDLIEDGRLEAALDRLDMLELLVSGELVVTASTNHEFLPPSLPRELIDLRSLDALNGLAGGMLQLKARIGKCFECRFLEALMGDLRRHIKAVPVRDTLQRWAAASLRTRGDTRPPHTFPAYRSMDDVFRSDMLAILNGLSRSNHTPVAAAAYRNAVSREMKVLIRQYLPSSVDDDAESTMSSSTRASSRVSQQEKSSILARNLRSLDWEDAERLFTNIYTDVSEALRRLSTQKKLLLDVSSGTAMMPGTRCSPTRSPNIASLDGFLSTPPDKKAPSWNGHLQEDLLQYLDMSSLLGQAVDAAQNQIAKLLKVRSEQSVRLPPQRFLRYFLINRLFADECEAVSGRSGAALKGIVDGQIRVFITAMGQSENQMLRQAMDADKWEARDLGWPESALLSRIVESAQSDAVEWTTSKMIWEPIPTTPAIDAEANEAVKAKHATVGGDKYVLVSCVLFALNGIERFQKLIAVIPSITAEVALTLLDYLRTFQSRACQLILGAGAKESAGLKSITTKHLALASQALNLIIALIPCLSQFIHRHSASTSVVELDRMRRLYQDQQTNIHDKLVEIMMQRLHVHVKAIRKMDFEAVADQQVSPPMETLTKETNTFHRTLSRHLPEASVRSIIMPVFAGYREQWSQTLRDAPVRTAAGKARLLRDAELLDSRLGRIDGFGDIGTYVMDAVRAKVVEDGATAAAPESVSSPPSAGTSK